MFRQQLARPEGFEPPTPRSAGSNCSFYGLLRDDAALILQDFLLFANLTKAHIS
jgi:hypothetical protein